MKEYFYEKDNEVYILDDEKGLSVEDAKDNTEETLIVQNNIEELEGQIEKSNEEKEQSIMSQKINKTNCIILRISSILGLPLIIYLTISTGTIFIPVMMSSLLLTVNIALSIANASDKTDIKSSKIYIKELQEELEKENKKLKTLKKIAKNKIVDYTAIKEVPKSEIISNLEFKKDLIEDYIKNRKKYISSYKEGTLNFLLYSNIYNQKDIDFIKYLIEEDLKNENVNCKKKVKQKNKTKTL